MVAPNSEASKTKRRFGLVLPVSLSGTDSAGKLFRQLAYTVDISNGGVRLAGVSASVKIGDPVELQYKQRRARFRVAWAAKEQIGLEYLLDEELIWELPVDGSLEDVSAAISCAGDGGSTRTAAVTKHSPEVGQWGRSNDRCGPVAMPDPAVAQREPGHPAVVLANDQNDRLTAAALAQGAIAEATVTSSTPAAGKSPSLAPKPVKDPDAYSTRTSGQLKTPAEKPSANEILKIFEQGIRQKLETISSTFETGLQRQAVEILNRTQAELESKVSSQLEHLRRQAEASSILVAKLHQQCEARLQSSHAELQELDAKREEFRRFSSALESRTAEAQAEIEKADRQITQRVQECNASCQQALTAATEEIRSHVRGALELAQKDIESTGSEALARIEDAAKKTEELLRRLDEAEVRIAKLAENAKDTLEKSMLAVTVETLERLQKEVDDRIQRSAFQLESTLAKAMESFCGALRESD